jgi:general secretion pathway protein C
MTLTLNRILALALVAILAFQGARLVWALTKPVGPVGRVTLPVHGGASAFAGPLAGFDPFSRGEASAGSMAITGLSLKLFGVRLDSAMGGGSAIIATPDGVQSSFAMGEEIVPGVKLKRVAFDNVTIDNGGREETLFLDQSIPAQTAGDTPPPAAVATATAVPPAGGGAINPASFTTDIGFVPRTAGGRVTGFALNPKGAGTAFRNAGLQPGDVLVSLNGNPVRSVEESIAAVSETPNGGVVTLQVERGGQTVTLNARTGK